MSLHCGKRKAGSVAWLLHLGLFGTCQHSQLWGVTGQSPMPELAKRPAFNDLHSGVAIAFAARTSVRNEKPSGRLTHLTAAPSAFLLRPPIVCRETINQATFNW